ncbi:MAG: BadF/BadG/BcrA/BcrD ATPase family protein [Eubacteriales bacterium]|nr:BadF/BadG/BcrA/BcrD ATPase family protein [Eubacteriales bacterium]MDD4389251.1 BadF/BadG/BcrA/BcrD ATPase family protein [Eubacteriales bacterium]
MKVNKKYYLGVDFGAASVSFAIINEDDEVKMAFTEELKTGAIESIKLGIEKLREAFNDNSIRTVGITGSGSEIASAVIGADTNPCEVEAIVCGVSSVLPGAGCIIKIGNRDSYFISMKDNKIEGFGTGDICASGIGAFIDKEAAFMGITGDELGERAIISSANTEIEGGCICFIEEEIVRKRQMGYSNDDIAAAICRGMTKKYVRNVIGSNQVNSPAVFVGELASNRGMGQMLSQCLPIDIKIPKYAKEIGAIGAAILSKNEERVRSRFRGFGIPEMQFKVTTVQCGDCTNNCDIVKIKTDNRAVGYFGDYCEKHRARL